MGDVAAEQAVVAEQLAPGAHQPADRREQPVGLGRNEIDRQPALPRLGLAPGVVHHPGLLGQPVEVVPLRLERPDGARVFVLQVDPLAVIALEREQLAELLLDLPVGSFAHSSSITLEA